MSLLLENNPEDGLSVYMCKFGNALPEHAWKEN